MADDRAVFLEAVRRGLGGPEAAGADEALRELSTHLDDQVADLVNAGEDPAGAERLALRGMGDPERLGRDLARAHRTPRRALALAGGGAFTFLLLGVVAYGLVLVGFAALAGLTITVGGLVLATHWPAAPGAYAGIAMAAIAAAWGAPGTVSSVVSQAPWPGRSVRLAAAAVILLVGLPVSLLVPNLQLDAPTAALALLVAPSGAFGALLAPARPTYAPGRLAGAVLVAALVLPNLLWAATDSLDTRPPSGIDFSPVARSKEATTSAGIVMPVVTGGSGFDDSNETERSYAIEGLTGWSDLRREVWAIDVGADGLGHPRFPALAIGEYAMQGHELAVALRYPSPRARTWTVAVDTAMAPDGVRSIVYLPDIGQTVPWAGSVLDWFVGP